MTDVPNEILYRTAVLERGSSKDGRQVRLAFSSEEPIERFFGIEVLDHSPASVDLSRLNSGRAPVLVDHKSDDQVGVVERVSVGDDHIGRAVVRFGNSPRASEILRDVRDGIRLNVSVGYRVNRMESAEDADVPTFRVMDWTPMKISIVSIPADASVGVGRSYGTGWD